MAGVHSAVETWIPEADKKICFDKFHIAQHLSKAVDQVRRAEHKTLKAQGDTSLKGTRYTWLRNASTRTRHHSIELVRLKKVALKTSRARAIKELGMDAWRYRSWGWARKGAAEVVRVGDSFQAGTDEETGQDDQESPGKVS